jgi:hypothetical protein
MILNEILGKVWDLLAGYNVQKIYIDGANPSFIKGLKIQWGERPDNVTFLDYLAGRESNKV